MTKKIIATVVGGMFALPLCAQQLSCDKSYAFRADVNGVIGNTICVSKATSFIDVVKDFTVSNSAYTSTSAAQVLGRFNDVNIAMNYAGASNTFNYNFIEINTQGSFTGVSRSDSQDQFVDFVKKSNIIGKLMNYQAMHSATSPITGAGGAIPMAAALDFSNSFDTLSKVTAGAPQDEGGSKNLVGVGLSYSSYNISGSSDKVSTTSLPLSYTIRNDIDPRRQLVFSMPLTRVLTGDASSYHGGLGASYRLPMSDQWTLTPGGKYSIVASEDRATVATMMSANLMSTYLIPLDGMDIAVGNMIGYYKTGKFSHGDYSFSPDVSLTMARNGIMLSMPTSLFGGKMAAEYSFIDTRYLGTKPFVASTQEVGVTIGTNRNATNARSYTRAGASYLRGNNIKGFTLNVGYWF